MIAEPAGAWKERFSKQYADADEEVAARIAYYVSNDAFIQTHNATLRFALGHNAFSDLSVGSFRARVLGFFIPRGDDDRNHIGHNHNHNASLGGGRPNSTKALSLKKRALRAQRPRLVA